jgi:hypothetical protein
MTSAEDRSSIESTPSNLAAAADRIAAELNRRRDEPMQFSPQAALRLDELHGEYLGDLGTEAVRIARSDGLQTVDAAHANQAAERLRLQTSPGPFANIAIGLGGMFAGAGMSFFYALFFTKGPHSNSEIAVASFCAVTGFTLIAIGVTVIWMLTRRHR